MDASTSPLLEEHRDLRSCPQHSPPSEQNQLPPAIQSSPPLVAQTQLPTSTRFVLPSDEQTQQGDAFHSSPPPVEQTQQPSDIQSSPPPVKHVQHPSGIQSSALAVEHSDIQSSAPSEDQMQLLRDVHSPPPKLQNQLPPDTQSSAPPVEQNQLPFDTRSSSPLVEQNQLPSDTQSSAPLTEQNQPPHDTQASAPIVEQNQLPSGMQYSAPLIGQNQLPFAIQFSPPPVEQNQLPYDIKASPPSAEQDQLPAYVRSSSTLHQNDFPSNTRQSAPSPEHDQLASDVPSSPEKGQGQLLSHIQSSRPLEAQNHCPSDIQDSHSPYQQNQNLSISQSSSLPEQQKQQPLHNYLLDQNPEQKQPQQYATFDNVKYSGALPGTISSPMMQNVKNLPHVLTNNALLNATARPGLDPTTTALAAMSQLTQFAGTMELVERAMAMLQSQALASFAGFNWQQQFCFPVGQIPDWSGGSFSGNILPNFRPPMCNPFFGRGGGGCVHPKHPPPPTASMSKPLCEPGQQPSFPPRLLARCELCNVSCNSAQILEQHKKGKKHQAKLLMMQKKGAENMKLGIPSQVKERVESAQACGEQKSEANLQCNNAEKVQHQNQGAADNKAKGKKRKHRGSWRGKPGGSYSSAQPLKHSKPKVVIPFVCDLCNAKCNSQEAFDSHVSGKKHVAKLKQFQGHQAAFGATGLQALYPPNPIAQISSQLNAPTNIQSQQSEVTHETGA